VTTSLRRTADLLALLRLSPLDCQNMEARALAERLDDVEVVDVREPDEWDAGHIERARHIPRDALGDRLAELDRSRPVVTVCRTGSRSSDAARALLAEGFAAESLDGGLLAWEEAGLEVVASDGAPGRVAEAEATRDDASEGYQRLQADFMSLTLEVQQHFGDHEPSEEEIRAYLRERLVDEGRSPEEADEMMGRITGEQPSG
jgi:rhodanese-related sulfurtransferase